MKRSFIFTFALLFCVSSLFAQMVENIKISGRDYPDFVKKNQYKYPTYTRASIVFNSGEKASARINYNNFSQVMTYINANNDTLEIANAGDIDFISVGTDSIFYDNGYYNWVASSATARLAMKHKYKEVNRALVGAFGTASPAKSIQSHQAIENAGSASVQISANEEITIAIETIYYISNLNSSNKSFVVATKKNIDKLFPKKKVEDFIKENKLNLNKEVDLIDLMVYISK